MKVVVNATPLIALSLIDRLELLSAGIRISPRWQAWLRAELDSS